MPVRGTLTKAQLGFSMPVNAPLYPRPPYLYRDASLIFFEYATDPSAAAAVLPEQVELADPPTAILAFAAYPWSSLGPYREVVHLLSVTYQGQPMRYALALYVTSDAAMASGRELEIGRAHV